MTTARKATLAANMIATGHGIEDIKVRLKLRTWAELAYLLTVASSTHAVTPWLRLARQRARHEARTERIPA